ncbi:hypothetical protein BN946_scf184988.g14 [Trametes cinnabarina]|uniref:Zn(2)-C6 fungal-type domain-containing protein n=1 Tax=Pycnoporus cinnabarinus TaxID=5643 RepID=A0A060SK76_PYCCI|nr:hypothetical protein BN946_scf184988.g14 [Trametes cinnabarina]
MANHPPHPQFLDVDWPQSHEAPPSQSLQLENEYDIDPSRFSILQNDFQPQGEMERHPAQQQQNADYSVNYGQPFGGQHDYPFTFPNPQQHPQRQPEQQQYNEQQVYGAGGQFYPDQQGPSFPQQAQIQQHPHFPSNLAFSDRGAQSMPSSPFYAGDASPFGFAQGMPSQGQGGPVGHHSRPGSASGLTPTVRAFQGGPHLAHRRPMFTSAGTPITPTFARNPTMGHAYPMPVHAGAPYREQGHMQLGDASAALHAAKRQRALEDGDGETSSIDGDDRSENGTHVKEEAKPAKPPGACARCKALKVKCEFKTNPEICKRCLNGGHECVIPGRKKRRAPPRRDVLLGQIREQAAKIEELMKQLEDANKRAGEKPHSGENAPSPAHSADHPSMSASASELTASDIGTPEPATDHITKPDVLDWIAKARESIEAFGGYINMGGPGVTKDMLGEDVLGWKDSSESDDIEEEGAGEAKPEEDGDVHVKVEDTDTKGGDRPVSRGRTAPDPTTEGKDESSTQSSRRKKSRGTGRDKLAILPNEAAPIGMLANLSLRASRSRRSSRSRSVSTVDDNDYGVANDDYFRASSPGPDRPIMYAQHQTPYILRSSLVSPAEVEKLFKIYFDYMNPSVSLLDPVMYTAQKTYWRSPFLFTVAAGSTLIGGQKSVETVQAYILLSLYPVPARKWEEDRCWVYLGLAIRIATDLNLHHPNTVEPKNEQHAREMLNRTRTWLNCFNLDRSMASQYGKAPIISNTDYVASHSEFWWKSSPYNIPGFDIHLCAYNAELKVLADYRYTIFSDPEHPVGLNKNLNITEIASNFDDKLANLGETWLTRIKEANFEGVVCEFRTSLLKLAYSYGRMTVLSFAFQHTFGRETSQGFSDTFFWRCIRASKSLIRTLLDELGSPRLRIYLRHGPDSECVFVTFTCAFLIKTLHPRYAQHIPRETRVELRQLVEEVAEFLGSPDVAVDDRHGPKLYSRFLKGLLETPLASIDHPPHVLKRAERPPAPSPGTPDSGSERPDSSPMPRTPVHVPHPPPSDQTTTKEQQTFLQTSPQDTQMFEGFELGYPDQSTLMDNSADFYSAPLPFDQEFLQSMQSLTDPNWSNMVLPGFSWMDAIQQDPDVQMRYNPDSGAPPQS